MISRYGSFVAVVIDPVRSMTNQKVDIGAFRVYPTNYKKEGTILF